jgi:proline dehydrogenase
MIDFQDTKTAFKLRSNADLRRARFLFNSIGNASLVKAGSAMALWALRIQLPIKSLVKATVFKQFCGGETIEECTQVIKGMNSAGVQSILDFSIEGKESDHDFDKTTQITIDTILFGRNNPGVPLAVFKPTGVGRISLWTKISTGESLSTADQKEWEKVLFRIERIYAASKETGIPVMMDAEESWMQDAADKVALDLMRRFNTEKVLVYNTLQMYRHDRLNYLQRILEQGKQEGFKIGVKIVRGAYMEKERLRAKQQGYPSPIQKDKAATDKDYDAAIELGLHSENCSIVAGTHNESSCQKLAMAMLDKNMSRNSEQVYFSQLYGMSDNLSFNLAVEGFNVAKYLPFGPVKDVMPYLIRRAEENTSVGGQTGRELQLIERELKRRKSV